MSLFTKLFPFFGTKIPHSELSNPIEALRSKDELSRKKYLLKVLEEVSRYMTPVCSHDFLQDTGIWSADKRLSDLKKLGYVDLEIRKEGRINRGYWKINKTGLDYLYANKE